MVEATATTDGVGAYGFTYLRPGSYWIDETQPSGYVDGKDAVGTVNGAINGALAPPDALGSIVLLGGSAGVNYNFGEVTATTPNLTIVKTADKTLVAPYQKVTYSYVVTNTGGTTLTNIVVTDDNATPTLAGDDFTVCTIASLAPWRELHLHGHDRPRCFDGGDGQRQHGERRHEIVVSTLANGDLKVTYLQAFGINDNTYGTGAIGWTNGHTFSNLTGSDKLEFRFYDKTGKVVLDFYQDTISATTNLAVYPRDMPRCVPAAATGRLVAGSVANIVSCTTSIADNLNKAANLPHEGGADRELADVAGERAGCGGSAQGAWRMESHQQLHGRRQGRDVRGGGVRIGGGARPAQLAVEARREPGRDNAD